jgi:raffinose/stachyose/melibiose transport system permease protein
MFQDDDILLAFKNTAIFTVAIVILRNLFAILLALALVKKLYTRTYLRTIFYIPAVLSYVVVGIMFTAMFQMNGTFNQILNAFGIPCTKEWLASGDTALLMVIVEDVWKWTGFHMIIYIAGLQAIPTDLYEAAKIDGASAVRTFFSVTLPLLIPSLTINVTQAIIGGFRVFEQVLTLTDGGPGHQSTVVSMMVYEYFGRGFYGKSTAISMMLSVIVLFVTLAVRGYFNKKAVSY